MKTKTWILRILIIILLAFIWIHSMMPRSSSSAESNAITDLLANIFPNITNNFVRKAAHFCEYGALGALFSLYVYVLKRKSGAKIFVNLLFSGLFVAIIDETIQIFSGRGAMVSDVWLDFSGVVFAALIVIFIVWATARRRAG